jgi:glycerol-3-phosphate dehydrogenase
MKRTLTELEQKTFDIIIIGGGITGACLAWDAINRGLTVALIEKDDFGAATSSASSKLLHGGIRYLQQGRIDKVRESALERVHYQYIAPHLSHYVPFVVPTYTSLSKGKLLLRFGMLLYHIICLGQNRRLRDPAKKVPGWRMLNKKQLLQYIPNLASNHTTGAVLFQESHMYSSERMTLAFINSCIRKGAVAMNYICADDFIVADQKVSGIKATDMLSGQSLTIRAECVINAAGPWIPLLNKSISTRRIVTAFSKGAHVVTLPITNNVAIALPTRKQSQSIINRGGRHVFIIPWRGHSLIGTTYDAYDGELDEVRPTENNIEELISDINSAFGEIVLHRKDIKYSFAGIYPLIDDVINTKVYQGTGEYQIVDHKNTDNLDGLVTVFGAKYTTARLLAEKALNKIIYKFTKPLKSCQTKRLQLSCGDIDNVEQYRMLKCTEYADVLPANVIDHLITYYGTEIDSIIKYVVKDKQWAQFLSTKYPNIEAQIIYAIEHEMACHLDDVLFRRTGLGTLGHPGSDVIERCANIMSDYLQWDTVRRESEIKRVLSYYQYH